MAEGAVGLALGIPGLFNSIIDIVQHVRIAQDTEASYDTDNTRLAYLEYRLTRLHGALGVDLNSTDEEADAALERTMSKNEVEMTKQLLARAYKLSDDTRRKSQDLGMLNVVDGAGTKGMECLDQLFMRITNVE